MTGATKEQQLVAFFSPGSLVAKASSALGRATDALLGSVSVISHLHTGDGSMSHKHESTLYWESTLPNMWSIAGDSGEEGR